MENSFSKFDKIRSAIGFLVGPTIFILILLLPAPKSFNDFIQSSHPNLSIIQINEISYSMKIVLALLLLMIILWVTEAIPIPVTALLPAIILPIFKVNGILDNEIFYFNSKNVLANYANPIIYLFLSGFLIARAMQKWNLDKRLTYSILSIKNLANNPKLIILALVSISAFLSMWISNTATTAMLLPLVIGIISLTKSTDNHNFAKALALSIAYGASIGGIATLIGTPPNGICVSILRTSGVSDINFLDWMKLGLPITLISIPVIWLTLIKIFSINEIEIPNGREFISNFKAELGSISKGEKLTLLSFFILLILWLSNPFWVKIFPENIYQQLTYFDENIIALTIALTMFFTPVDWKNRKFILDWNDSKFIDWGTLLLFGGGIALSDSMFKTGLAGWIAINSISLIGNSNNFIILITVILLIDFLTEVTSNTAVTSMMLPILLSISSGLNIDGKLLALGATFASSMAFMLPVATPPNAIVYGTGYLKITDMIKAGFLLDILAWLIIIFVLYIFGNLIFGIVKF
ncbi:MAG: SLC13 family permease [Ignavibacteria bacterium]